MSGLSDEEKKSMIIKLACCALGLIAVMILGIILL